MNLHAQIIQNKGKPEYVILPYKEYKQILEELEMFEDTESYRAAKERNEESYPIELVKSIIIEDENPIKVFREYRKMTQKQLGEKVKVKASYISELESGKKNGSIAVMKKIAEVLKVDLDSLV